MAGTKTTPERKRLVTENAPEVDAELRAIAKDEGMKPGQLVRLALANFVRDYRAAESAGERVELIRV